MLSRDILAKAVVGDVVNPLLAAVLLPYSLPYVPPSRRYRIVSYRMVRYLGEAAYVQSAGIGPVVVVALAICRNQELRRWRKAVATRAALTG